MSRIARATLFDLPVLTLDEMIEKVEEVTISNLTGLAGEIYAGERLSAAAVGREEMLFRGAAPSVSESLVAA